MRMLRTEEVTEVTCHFIISDELKTGARNDSSDTFPTSDAIDMKDLEVLFN